jgi:hypothetical protein
VKHREKQILVEFKGEVSPENRRFLLRRVALHRSRTVFLALVPATTLMSLVLLDLGWVRWLCIAAAFVVLDFVGALLTYLLTQTPKEQKELFTNHICFYADRDQSVLIEGSRVKLDYYCEDFPQIVDKGKYYFIDIPAREGWGVICQKNLMVQGTIEEFEALFGDKLVRE